MTSSCMSKFRFRMNISHSICDPKNYKKVRTLKDNLFIIIWPIYVILTVMIPKLLYFIWWKYEQGNKYLQNCNFHDSLRTYVSNIKDKVFIFFYRSSFWYFSSFGLSYIFGLFLFHIFITLIKCLKRASKVTLSVQLAVSHWPTRGQVIGI